MLNHLDRFAVNARLLELTARLPDGLDPDFDAGDDLDREFQELRLRLSDGGRP